MLTKETSVITAGPTGAVVQLTTLAVLLLTWLAIYLLPLTASGRALASAGIISALAIAAIMMLGYRTRLPEVVFIVADALFTVAIIVTILAAGSFGLFLIYLLFVLLAVHAFFMSYLRLVLANIFSIVAAALLVWQLPTLASSAAAVLLVALAVGLISLSHIVWFYAKNARRWQRQSKRAANTIKRLRQAESEKTEILSLVSHQLKTPLALIRWSSESVLHNTKLSVKERERLEQSIATTHVMYRTIEDLSHIFKLMVKGKSYLKFEKIAVADVVTELIKEYETVAESQGIKLQFSKPRATITVRADRVFLKHAVVNLVDNALKYSPSGSTVTVTLKKERSVVKILVADQGMGIEPANLKRIFERFFRTDRAREVHEHGTGLGLYLVRTIIHRLGGEIDVTSKVNKGTNFTITLKTV